MEHDAARRPREGFPGIFTHTFHPAPSLPRVDQHIDLAPAECHPVSFDIARSFHCISFVGSPTRPMPSPKPYRFVYPPFVIDFKLN